MGPSSSPPKRGQSPQFLAHFYCGQTAGCIKMPLGMELGLTPGDFVLDRDPAPTPLKRHSPQFSVRLLWPKGWMDANATWYGSRRRPKPHCVTQGPSSPAKGAQQPPHFGLCLLWPRSPISATGELLWLFLECRFCPCCKVVSSSKWVRAQSSTKFINCIFEAKFFMSISICRRRRGNWGPKTFLVCWSEKKEHLSLKSYVLTKGFRPTNRPIPEA